MVEDDEDQSEDNDSSLHVSNKVSTHVASVYWLALARCGGGPVSWWCDLHTHLLKIQDCVFFKIYS